LPLIIVIYDKESTFGFLLAKAPGEYATILRVFKEIANRRKEWSPRTMLDFGSGVGTAVW